MLLGADHRQLAGNRFRLERSLCRSLQDIYAVFGSSDVSSSLWRNAVPCKEILLLLYERKRCVYSRKCFHIITIRLQDDTISGGRRKPNKMALLQMSFRDKRKARKSGEKIVKAMKFFPATGAISRCYIRKLSLLTTFSPFLSIKHGRSSSPRFLACFRIGQRCPPLLNSHVRHHIPPDSIWLCSGEAFPDLVLT